MKQLATPPYKADYWQTRIVPGFTQTLEQMYGAVKAANGWPDDITDSATGLLDTAQGMVPRNRSYMMWRQGITEVSRAFVMENCAYSLIREAWPNAAYGNYDEMLMDGQMSKTGWMWDRPDEASQYTGGSWYVSGSNPVKVNEMPRSYIEPVWGGFQHRAAGGRYHMTPRPVYGNRDMPRFYGMPDTAPISGYRLAAQTSLYLPPGTGGPCDNGFAAPCEMLWDVTMRLSRHTAESVIDSGAGMRSDRLVPWVEMVGSFTGNTGDPMEGTRRDSDIRRLLAMLRGKNIGQGMFFLQTAGALGPAEREMLWQMTSQLLHEVYQTRITGYTRVLGAAPTGASTESHDPSRLEFTLLDQNRRERFVSIRSAPVIIPGTPLRSELVVDFDWTDCDGLGALPTAWHFDVTIEVQTDRAEGTVGRLQFGTPGAGGVWRWTDVETCLHDTNHKPIYRFYTPPEDHTNSFGPITPGSAGYHWARRTFNVVIDTPLVIYDDNGVCRSKLKLILENPDSMFWARYDLVQVMHSTPWGICAGLTEGLAGDMNYDGVVDESDLIEFAEHWFEGTLKADVDMNGTVNVDDVDAFVGAYANQG